jgi:hypothetical protein
MLSRFALSLVGFVLNVALIPSAVADEPVPAPVEYVQQAAQPVPVPVQAPAVQVQVPSKSLAYVGAGWG